MKHEIVAKPDYPCVKVSLDAQESIIAETGAMVAMSSNVAIQTQARGGLLSSAKRALMGGESFFVNTFTAQNGPGEIYFTSATTGDMSSLELANSELIMSTGAFVCSSPTVNIDSSWGGFKSFFAGEGLFFLKASGSGTIIFSSFGAIHQVDVDGEYHVDTGHIVAFDPSLSFSLEKVGGLKSLFLSGEGFICRFSGRGRLFIQTRNHNSYAAWANQFRRVERKSN